MNTNRWGLLAIALTIIAAAGILMLVIIPTPNPITNIDVNQPATSTATTTNNGTGTTTEGSNIAGIADLIMVGQPTKNAVIGATSTTLTGSARGFWYFEASFPVQIKDASGKVIAQGPAQAQSEWMTTDFVIFKATLTYPKQPKGSKGTVVLMNDNPSGLPENQKTVEIPVTFN